MGAKNISKDEVELFRKSVGEVNRLRDDRFRPRQPRPRPVLKNTGPEEERGLEDMLSDDPYDRGVETGETLFFARPGPSARTLKRLRRGQLRVDAELDLHGKTVAEAQHALAPFLMECGSLGIRCVRIIHGKGFGSPHGIPVIKSKLDRWLRLRDDVLAFSSARPVDGGTGAVYVLLRT